MNTKDNQRSRLTKILMKQAFLTMMHEKPAEKITVKDICEKAEVNRSTFYIHYTEPNDILMEIEDDTIALVVQAISSIGALEDDSPDARKYLLVFLRHIQRNDEILRTLLIDNSNHHFRRKLQTVALELAKDAFDINLSDTLKSCAYLFIVSGSIELLMNWIQSDYALSEQVLCDTLLALCGGCLRNLTSMKSL